MTRGAWKQLPCRCLKPSPQFGGNSNFYLKISRGLKAKYRAHGDNCIDHLWILQVESNLIFPLNISRGNDQGHGSNCLCCLKGHPCTVWGLFYNLNFYCQIILSVTRGVHEGNCPCCLQHLLQFEGNINFYCTPYQGGLRQWPKGSNCPYLQLNISRAQRQWPRGAWRYIASCFKQPLQYKGKLHLLNFSRAPRQWPGEWM